MVNEKMGSRDLYGSSSSSEDETSDSSSDNDEEKWKKRRKRRRKRRKRPKSSSSEYESEGPDLVISSEDENHGGGEFIYLVFSWWHPPPQCHEIIQYLLTTLQGESLQILSCFLVFHFLLPLNLEFFSVVGYFLVIVRCMWCCNLRRTFVVAQWGERLRDAARNCSAIWRIINSLRTWRASLLNMHCNAMICKILHFFCAIYIKGIFGQTKYKQACFKKPRCRDISIMTLAL